jgi:chromosome segregation ATPase
LSNFKSLYSKERNTLLSEIESLKQEKALLEQKNSDLNEKIISNEAKLIAITSELGVKTRSLSALEDYLPQLQKSVEKKEHEFNSILNNIELNEEKLLHLSKRLENANRDLDIRKIQLESYEASISSSQQTVNELEDKITKYENLKNEIFRNIKNALLKESSLKEKIERLKKHLNSLEGNRYEIESNIIKTEENFITMASAYKQEINDLKVKVREISKKLIDKELILFRKSEEIAKKEKAITNLEIEFRSILYRVKSGNEEIESISAKKSKLQNEIIELSAQKTDLENSVNATLSELERAGEKSHETEESFIKVIQNFKEEIEALRKARDEAANEYSLIEQRLSLLKLESQKSERSISGIILENDQLAAERDILSNEIAKLVELKTRLDSADIENIEEHIESPVTSQDKIKSDRKPEHDEEEVKERIMPPYGYSGIDKELLSYLSSELKDFGSESINKELESLTAALIDGTDVTPEPEIKIQTPADSQELKDLIKKINQSPNEEGEK